MENSNEKTIRYLQDSHAAESGTAEIFEGHSRDNHLDANLRQQAGQFLATTREQQRLIEGRIHALGGDTSNTKGFVNNLLSKASDLLNIGHDSADKLTQDLIKTFAAENLHIGAYESLRAYATTIGDAETAQLAVQLRKMDEGIAQEIFRAIGQSAPEAADKATDTAGGQGTGSVGTTTSGSTY